MKALWSGWKSASTITDSLPLILTGLNSGAGGAVRPDEVAAAAWPAGLAAGDAPGEAAAAGDAPGEAAAAGDEAGAAAGAVGLAASVGFAAAVGAAGAVVPPQAARIGSAAAARPIRSMLRRDRRPGIEPVGEPRLVSLTRHLLGEL